MRLVWSVTRRFRNLFEIKLTYSSLRYPVTLEPFRKNFKEINVGPKRLFVSAKNSARECLFITPHLSLEPFGKNCKKNQKQTNRNRKGYYMEKIYRGIPLAVSLTSVRIAFDLDCHLL